MINRRLLPLKPKNASPAKSATQQASQDGRQTRTKATQKGALESHKQGPEPKKRGTRPSRAKDCPALTGPTTTRRSNKAEQELKRGNKDRLQASSDDENWGDKWTGRQGTKRR